MRNKIWLLVFLLYSCSSFSWNALGHMVIANIAYENLDKVTQNKVDKMVGYFHQEYKNIDSLIKMAPWPDALRGQKIETFTHWHYINLPIATDNRDLSTKLDTDNAVWALEKIDDIIKYTHSNVYERARFLAFFVHIVGDLHQPLHAVQLFSAAHPQGDQGGNLYYVRYHNQRTKLHTLWDSGLGVFAEDSTPEQVNQISQQLTAFYPKTYFGKAIDDLEPMNWAQNGVELAEKYVYNTPEDQPISENYIVEGQQVAQQQATLAGYRLANFMNQLLGASESMSD